MPLGERTEAGQDFATHLQKAFFSALPVSESNHVSCPIFFFCKKRLWVVLVARRCVLSLSLRQRAVPSNYHFCREALLFHQCGLTSTRCDLHKSFLTAPSVCAPSVYVFVRVV